ncbi:MAG TPA: histidine kinase dimerization/phospho-acceptor domain-containing protein, partial [Candidatus Saccharimonas sp.]|nr:histidine kinase dimerization/phospho-acceptor domain-containing protein [Candidatus Saccharimonas sp.]
MPILQIISIIIALAIGVLVLLRNMGDRNRWLLLFFNAVTSLWVVSYILADTHGDYELFWNRMVFAGGLFVVYGGYLLVASMANRFDFTTFASGILLAAWSGVILFTPAIVGSVEPRFTAAGLLQGFDVTRGWAYPLYVASLLAAGLGVIGFVVFLQRRSRGRFKAQLGIISAGFVAMLVIGVFTGVVLPLLAKNSEPANYTFLSVFAVMAAFTYSIVQQRLFDIRLAIARSLGYFLALAVISIFYVVGIFALADVVFKNQADIGLRIYYIIAALFVALTFGPLRQFFSRITRKVFFRDSYDTETVIGNLTTSLVGNVDLDILTQTASHILQDAMKVEFLHILTVRDDDGFKDVFAAAQHISTTLLVTDELSSRHKRLAEKLNEANVALLSRLQTHQEVVGYLVCGPKARGDALTPQDIELVRVASGELAVAVQNALRFDEISHFNETLKQEVEEATAQLRESNRKLKKLDEAKDEFISMASHQLRTPLTSVKGYISMVMEGDAGKLTGPQQRLLQEAFTAAQRMVYLIGDFLNVSRLQTGRFTLELKRSDLAQVVNDEVSQLATTAARRNITIQYHHPVQFPMLTLDENKIRQVIMNFIDNAIFYSRPSSVVEVTLVNTGHEIRFEVRDSGIGVPVSEQHKLFTKFFRAENAR